MTNSNTAMRDQPAPNDMMTTVGFAPAATEFHGRRTLAFPLALPIESSKDGSQLFESRSRSRSRYKALNLPKQEASLDSSWRMVLDLQSLAIVYSNTCH